MTVNDSFEQDAIRVLRDAFAEYGDYRVTHLTSDVAHTEFVSATQLAAIAYHALQDAGMLP